MADHIKISPAADRITISASGMPLGTTSAALELTEGGYGPVIYVPRADIDVSKLQRTDRATACPYKGKASYFSIVTPAGVLENAVWSYETPRDGVQAIAGHLAFYPDKVSFSRG